MKKVLLIFMIAALSVTVACQEEEVAPIAGDAEVKANWSASGRWDSWQNGGYTVRNNIWGNGHGYQGIWANSYSNWGVWADHPNTGGIKSYPHSARNVNRRISQLGWLNSSFNVSTPGSGSYVTAYDIWLDNHGHEIMLWMNWRGNVNPISYNWNSSGNPVPVYWNVWVGGHTWNVYRGSNGSNNVYSFLRTSKTSSGTVNIKAILDWIRARGWFGDSYVQDVQFGYEITSSSGGLNFRTNSYSVSY